MPYFRRMMHSPLLLKVKSFVRRLFAIFGYSISLNKLDEPSKGGVFNVYSSAERTIAAARAEGLTLCEFVEKLWGRQGDTQRVIDRLASLGVYNDSVKTLLEIGPGTGRYLEKTLQLCKPSRVETYEVLTDWADYNARTFGSIPQHTDGESLGSTSSKSVDLLQAHGVFVARPFITNVSYWQEIWRVVRPGGAVVFDIISEACMDIETVAKWREAGLRYPSFCSKDYAVKLFKDQGFELVSAFLTRYAEGKSEYLVFRLPN